MWWVKLKMKRLSQIFFLSIMSSGVFLIWGCNDLVKEDDAKSGCENALNDRDYDTALRKCSARKDIATAYMGKAGFDVINLINASSSSTTAITESTVTTLLGKENVSFVKTLRTLKLTKSAHPEATAREKAMEASKFNLENVIDLYDGKTDQTKEELVLQTLGTLYATNLEILLLLDVGIATIIDITSATFRADLLASRGKILITGSKTIPSSSIAVSTVTFANSTSSVDVVMAKLDGRIWAKEQNSALMPESIGLSPATQALLGTPQNSINLYGNLPTVCRSSSDSKISSDPVGKGILTLLSNLTTAISRFNAAFSGSSSDTITDVSKLNTAVNTFKKSIDTACNLLGNLPVI